jgi:hypothetical protein
LVYKTIIQKKKQISNPTPFFLKTHYNEPSRKDTIR